MKYLPKQYQDFATKHITENWVTASDGAGLFLEMGLGKTVSTLTAINELIYEVMDISKVLIIAPKLVAEHTWSDEIAKWDHIKHLTFSRVLGTEKDRIKALKVKADIYIINRENVVWLVAYYGMNFPFEMLVIDELSSFKNPKSARFKALRTIRPLIKRVVGLTGTPAPNGMMDLWSQLYLMDMGKRLGNTLVDYRTKYFRKEEYKPFNSYKMIEESDELIGNGYYQKKIYERIGDICISMKTSDWLDLPERIDVDRHVYLNPETAFQYEEFEREEVLKIAELEDDISPMNATGLINKLLQFSNGAVYYNDQRDFYEVHNDKIEMLGETLEAANGNPMLVIYQFQSDVERIRKHLKAFNPVHIRDAKDSFRRWNEGKIPVLLGHAASMGHGLNMQDGGHLITHFGVGWPLEFYQQVVARVHRQGQGQSVINTRLICPQTYELKVLHRLNSKAGVQESLMQAVKALIVKHRK